MTIWRGAAVSVCLTESWIQEETLLLALVNNKTMIKDGINDIKNVISQELS